MRFMVIETYLAGAAPVYERLRESGRSVPAGVTFVDSWVDASLGRCWQVMDAEDENALTPWMAAWSDLVAFEVVPVLSSAEAAARSAARP